MPRARYQFAMFIECYLEHFFHYQLLFLVLDVGTVKIGASLRSNHYGEV